MWGTQIIEMDAVVAHDVSCKPTSPNARDMGHPVGALHSFVGSWSFGLAEVVDAGGGLAEDLGLFGLGQGGEPGFYEVPPLGVGDA